MQGIVCLCADSGIGVVFLSDFRKVFVALLDDAETYYRLSAVADEHGECVRSSKAMPNIVK